LRGHQVATPGSPTGDSSGLQSAYRIGHEQSFQAAPSVPRTLPEIFDRPPSRGLYGTGT